MKLSRDDCVSSEENRLRNVPLATFDPVRSAADSVVLFVTADAVDVVEDIYPVSMVI